MNDNELRLRCLIAASSLMSKKQICVFNKETYRWVENPMCLADIYVNYVKTGNLTYLNNEEMSIGSDPTKWERTITELQKENTKLKEHLKRKGFLRFLRLFQ